MSMSIESDSGERAMDRAVKTFGLDEDETLQFVATTPDGEMRQIGRVARPGEYAVVYTDVLVSSSPSLRAVNESEQLDVEHLSVVGDTVTIGPND